MGVGLIPGAGGNLRVLTHFLEKMPPGKLGPMVPVQKAFETIAFAKISASAYEAVELGYLRPENKIVLSRDHQIALAKELEAAGIKCTPVVNHDASETQASMEITPTTFVRSIYFTDPDGIMLEFAAWTREMNEDDVGVEPQSAI